MAFIFRAMTRDGEKPAIGPTARCLGVRLPPDKGADLPIDESGRVNPTTGGMFVGPDWRKLPSFRIPRRLRHMVSKATGSNLDACFRLNELPFVSGAVHEGLVLRIDKPSHGMIEPALTMRAEEFQQRLAETRDDWVIDEN